MRTRAGEGVQAGEWDEKIWNSGRVYVLGEVKVNEGRPAMLKGKDEGARGQAGG